MSNIYYIADTHFGHEKVITMDDRPFRTIQEMDDALIANWNSVVKKPDKIFILGDFCWNRQDRWLELLQTLHGEKVLIKGNHDLKQFPSAVKNLFADIKDYKEIDDKGRKVILSHYCIPFYKHDRNENVYHLYGHVHNTVEHKLLEEFKKYIKSCCSLDTYDNELFSREYDEGNLNIKCNFYNVWCGFYDWKPVTLDQIIERWK